MTALYRETEQFPLNHSHQLAQTLEELSLAVEELHVAEEELLAQNEQLAAANHIIEAERQRYQDLFNFAPDGYLVTDMNGVVLEANHAAVALLHLNQSYLIGKPLVAHIPPAERVAFRTLLNHITRSRRIEGWELTLQNRRAAAIVVSTTVEVVKNAEGLGVGLRWQMRDISDRKKAEATLSQLQAENLELLEADRLRAQLLATVSHEFKTPLNAILGFSQVLMAQFDGRRDFKSTKMVQRIFHNGQHLLGMVEDMLNFSRLRADQVELNLETFDLTEMIVTTLAELESLAQQKALTLKTQLPDHPVVVVNDRGRLRQILTNLISNAIKFTDVGQVVVSLEELPDDRLVLQVKDTGCGISPEDQQHIFQEFWQVHDARNTIKGTGLGLAIVYALVQVMQGTVTVDSELGQGSDFCIELPQSVAPTQNHPAACRPAL
ncbi:HAMP domain-containing histidine kinase [Phormidium sp. FACHB-322]|nr:HAMP domain-containing histidine kinase [Phormidium sp. FACHB-77]MBD2031984.1 HAMP domain-containing histidine kinase [Phormidium sp. FACHB-322]MBD2053947.1 HAMP domain-containing histidine kinase [Leptolyngbya sp. FACHB-60]